MAPNPGEAGRGPELQGFSTLSASQFHRFEEQRFGGGPVLARAIRESVDAAACRGRNAVINLSLGWNGARYGGYGSRGILRPQHEAVFLALEYAINVAFATIPRRSILRSRVKALILLFIGGWMFFASFRAEASFWSFDWFFT